MTFTVSHASIEDVPRLLAAETAAWGLQVTMQVDMASVVRFGWAFFAVADGSDDVLGAILVEPTRDGEAHIADVFVDKAQRRSGVGRALVEYAQRHVDRSLVALVDVSNLASLRLLTRAGFVGNKIEQDPYCEGEGASSWVLQWDATGPSEDD